MSAAVESSAPAANPEADAVGLPVPKKFKASDLPLPSATRTAIEGLAHTFKKKGGYDAIRKQVWEEFEASDYEAQVTKAILEVAEQEVERNPTQLLTLERGKAAALIDGALDRGGVYQKAEGVISALIDSRAIEAHIRQLRRAEIGDEAAEEERARGAKTDEEYAAETAARRAERERVRAELRAVEEKKRQLEREIKAREDTKRRETERAAREERRKKEREE
ncbi:complex proteins associated with Set1p component shg1-domain-containing protein, partial [Chaetomidium leptoderma]